MLDALLKLVVFIALFSSIGYVYCSVFFASSHLIYRHHTTMYVVAGLAGVLVNFLHQIKTFTEEGWVSVFDSEMAQILWESSVGDMTLLRVIGLVLILVGLLISKKQVQIVGILVVTLSFAMTGHTVDFGWLGTMALMVHVLVVGWWVGLLIPLLRSTNREVDACKAVMKVFSQHAVILVPVGLAAGSLLAYEITQGFSVWSFYTQVLIGKITLVAMALILAARHKFLLVPHIKFKDDLRKLRYSIYLELLVISGVVLITATLSTTSTTV